MDFCSREAIIKFCKRPRFFVKGIFISILTLIILTNSHYALPMEPVYRVENDRLYIEFSKKSGAIQSIYNKERKLELINLKPHLPPWELELIDYPLITDCDSFSFKLISEKENDRFYLIEWQAKGQPVRIECRIHFRIDSSDIHFKIHVFTSR